jgi:benzoate-CoA ligase family protein
MTTDEATSDDFDRPTFPDEFNLADYYLHDRLDEGLGDKPAVLFGDRKYTFEGVAERSTDFARYLRSAGVDQEQRVYTVLPDTPPFVWSFYGTLQRGSVVAMANPYSPPDDLEYGIEYGQMSALVTLPETAEAIADTLLDSAHLETLVLVPDVTTGEDPEQAVDIPEVFAEADFDVCSMTDALERGRRADDSPFATTHKDDVGIWLFTAGSTGRPKACIHSHRDFAYNTEVFARQTVGFREDDLTISVSNLYFGLGTGTNLMFPHAVGATVGLFSERPTPEVMADAIHGYRPTIVTNVPTMMSKMLDYETSVRADGGQGIDMSSVRFHISAGEPLSPDLLEEFMATYDVEVCDGIGSAEMFHIYATNRPGDIEPGSLGKPVDGYEIRILPIDADGPGTPEVPDGDIGEMWVKGDSIAHGYYRKREASWETFYGHWCRTGDLFRRDVEGYLHMEGRADNMFKASGIWVSPLEVEECLQEHEAVANSAVIPAEKEDGLAKPKAFVVVREGHQARVSDETSARALRNELQDYVKSTISKHKYPRWVIFVDELPRNDRDKVDKKVLERREEAGENPWK